MSTEDSGSQDKDTGDQNNDACDNWEVLPDDYTQFDFAFKVIVIGDSGVGKSCLSARATKNIFEDSYKSTIGFDFFVFNIKFNDAIVKLQVWDTCGQELYRTLITNFYRNSSLAIIVYAINSKQSFENIEMWLREIRRNSNPDAKIFLIGNKLDLESEREVDKETVENYAKKNKMSLFMEASAKTGFNAQNIFIDAAKVIYRDFKKYQRNALSSRLEEDSNKKLGDINKKKKKVGKCC